MNIGKKLKNLRIKRGLVQKQVEDKSGISRKTISDAENDDSDEPGLSITTLEKILSAYKMTLADFFESRVWTDKEGIDKHSIWLDKLVGILDCGDQIYIEAVQKNLTAHFKSISGVEMEKRQIESPHGKSTPKKILPFSESGTKSSIPDFSISAQEFEFVPHYDVSAAAGSGSVVDKEEIIENLAFRRSWLKTRRLDASHLVLINCSGDSMEPTIHSGDTLLVDIRKTALKKGRIYVLKSNHGLITKRYSHQDENKLYFVSDNPLSGGVEIQKQNQEIIVGRVAWFGREM